VAVAKVDHALLRDLWAAVARDPALPEPWSQLEQGVIPEGTLELRASDDGAVNWQLSRGTLLLAFLRQLEDAGDRHARCRA